jgi:acetyl-CoA synthetase
VAHVDPGRSQSYPVKLKGLIGAGEPLNPEVIQQIRNAWNIIVRDGFGQTESSVLIANTPGQPVKVGSMGRPLPGFRVALLDPTTSRRKKARSRSHWPRVRRD